MADAITAIFGVAEDALDLIQGNSLLMLFACSGVVGIAIGIVKKLIGRY